MISALYAAPVPASLSAGVADWLAGAPGSVWRYVGKLVTGVVDGIWQEIMLGIWQLSLRVLQSEIWLLGALSEPDVSETGPLQRMIPISLAISASIATLMLFSQLMLALWRRDGGGLAHIVYGTIQWACVYLGTWGVCAGLIEAASQLEGTIISLGFNVPNFANLKPEQIMALPTGQGATEAMARDFTDSIAATAYGVSSLFLFLPAGLLGMGVALTRMGSLMILVVTLPISAGGLIHEFGSRIFWRSARWFIATLLISPNIALLFAIGVQISSGVTQGQGKDILGSFGTALVSGFIMLSAAYSPVALYRLFGWMEPGTAANAQMRQLMSDAKGGFGGLIGGGGGGGGGGEGDQAGKTSGDGRAAGESNADGATGHRFGMAGQAAGAIKSAGSDLAAKMVDHGGLRGKVGSGAQRLGGAMGGAKDAVSSRASQVSQSPRGQQFGAFLAKGQSMADSAAAGARNMQADVLGGSGVGDRLDNYAGPPSGQSGGPRATNTIRPLGNGNSVDLGAQMVGDSQHHPGGHDAGSGDGDGGMFGPTVADMGTAASDGA